MIIPNQRGSASVEYVLVIVAVVFVLFVPIAGEGRSVVDLLLDALRGFQANSTYLLSMP